MRIKRGTREHAIERLMARIAVRGDDECWPWTGSQYADGYGQFWFEGKNHNASRAAFVLLVGPVPDGKEVCHRCDNPPCCNPKHHRMARGVEGAHQQ